MKKTKSKKNAKDKSSPGADPCDVTTEPEVATETPAPVESVEALRAKIESLEDSLLRAKADYKNFQRRSAMQCAETARYANAELIRSLLGVIDDFERSLASAQSCDNLQAVMDGVRLVHENFMKVLEAQGLEGIEALGRPFDPNIHQALMQQPSADAPPGTVLEEIAKGYRLGDRVLRPAKVIVSQAPEQAQVRD